MYTVFFLRTFADHDVSGFTTFELRKVLDFLMDELDSSDRDTYLNLRTQFSSLPREDVNRTVTTWPPQIHLLMKVLDPQAPLKPNPCCFERSTPQVYILHKTI